MVSGWFWVLLLYGLTRFEWPSSRGGRLVLVSGGVEGLHGLAAERGQIEYDLARPSGAALCCLIGVFSQVGVWFSPLSGI